MDHEEIRAVSDILRRGLEEYGLAGRVSPRAVQDLSIYCQMLLDKNREMNLTAITDPVDAANLHMLDCAALLNCADFEHKSLIDVGTGAGFPGMVLKILVPSLDVTLLDSLNKRLDWLAEVAGALELTGVHTVHGRAEEAGLDRLLRERFDFATARAVADLRVLSELCLPFVKVGGRFLAMKSTGSDEEIEGARAAIQTLGGRVERSFDYTIPGTDVIHRVVVVEKTAPTPTNYPRRWAKIQKAPL
ncbi:MAG: 16S rRNA (guanine(527)-N(7))-methyltransferase RsmG [Oscillospiraceae bacterium]|nr:16S rRNA (guanine(527)-N(7))-methyltransferase RsmG [Oscillospiraceae bacterium]